jgi:hypothetical protein
MKTILVIYTHTKLNKTEHQTLRRYSFNTASSVKVNQMFKLALYDTPVQVVEILPKCYKYVDTHSGKLSNKREANTKQYEIREVVLRTKQEAKPNVIEGVAYDHLDGTNN